MIHPLPSLQTKDQNPLNPFEAKLLLHKTQIEIWFADQFSSTPPPITCSIDLRQAGFKCAPVDTNLFPAGFNNLSPDLEAFAVVAFQHAMTTRSPKARRITLVSESHSRNLHYFESLCTLANIIRKAGFDVVIGMIPLTTSKTITLPNGTTLTLDPLTDRLDADVFILNHDLSEGIPEVLLSIQQPICPPLALGWSRRSKKIHFAHYQSVCEEFAAWFDYDPWFFEPLFKHCSKINFLTKEGEDCLLTHATQMFSAIQAKYDKYHIPNKPYVVIKSDTGTYGMNVLMISDPEELRHLNRKQRSKMATGKGKVPVQNVILQEGVPTLETLNNAACEPVLYLIGEKIIGGFYRAHPEKSATESLNAPGMQFTPMTLAENTVPDRFYTYSVIARLAVLAAAFEIKEVVHA